jgi:Icc-related predicted phosphoesterase
LIEGMLTLILTKHLPLKPYKDWIKEQIKAVNEGVKVIPTTIVGTEIKITPYKDIVAFSEEEIKSNLEKLKED